MRTNVDGSRSGMMFQGEDRQTLQTMIDNNTITAEDKKKHLQKLSRPSSHV